MFKKIGIAAAVVGAGVFLTSAAGLWSYGSTLWSQARNGLKKQVPLEFEIERIRHEVAQLVPDMKKNFTIIAEEMVAVENLQKEITLLKGNLRQQKENVLTMTRDLETGNSTIVYDGRSYSSERVREKLARDFASYQTCEAELRSKEQLLEAKERSLDAAREQLASLKAQKQELEIQVAQLEAEVKTVRLAQTRNKVHVDDSQLARCKSALAEIRDRLNVEKKESELEAQFANDAIPVEKKAKSTEELVKEIRSRLGEGKVAAD